MSLQLDVRHGSQVPRIESVPLWHTTAADEAIDLAAACGLVLDPWQERVLRGSLGERPDGKWSAFRACLVCPRQNGKNAILEARELAGLFLFGEQLITHTAHQGTTARNAMTALMRRMKNVPELMDFVDGYEGPDQSIKDIDGFKVGNDPGIYLKDGRAIRYATRSGDAGRGFTGDLVVLDEAYSLTAAEMGALLPTLSAKSMRGNPQLWITSSAGKVASEYLESLREQGMSGNADRLAYYEWSAPDDAALDDVDAWYESNPALGIRISEEYVRDEFNDLTKTELGREEFKRERLGVWASIGGDRLIPDDVWASGATSEPLDHGLPVAFALDVPPSRDVATLCAAAQLPDGRVRFEIVDRFDNFHVIADKLKALEARWSPVAIVVDAMSAAGTLIDDLRRARVRTRQLNGRQYTEACARFFDLVVEGSVEHGDQPELNEAVAAAERKTRPNSSVWVWARKNTMADISPLVGCTLALHGLNRSRSDKKKRQVTFL